MRLIQSPGRDGLRGGLGMTLLALVALVGCPVKEATPVDVGPSVQLQVTAQDHVVGSNAASVTVIEYGDLECPICGLFALDTYPALKTNYIDTGRVRWVYRHLPLTQKHPHARVAAEACECAAAQGKFWEYHDVLLANQLALTDADLSRYAAQIGLDPEAFSACAASGASAARVDVDLQSAAALGVQYTPTFYVGQQRVIGLLSVGEFSGLLDTALAAATE